MFEYCVGYNTEIGNTHSVNQDSICLRTVRTEAAGVLYAGVFDGMGGLSEGERISGAAAKLFSDYASRQTEDPCTVDGERFRSDVSAWFAELNEKVRAFDRKNGISGGTTAVMLFTDGLRYRVCNVGDSRAYLLRGGMVTRLSRDHTQVARLVEAGMLTEEAAARQNIRSLLTQAVGTLEVLTPDFSEGECEDGDTFLLCSDGLYGELSGSELLELAEIPAERTAMTGALQELTHRVMERGETDNITGILIKVKK